MDKGITYSGAGVDIDTSDAMKKGFAKSLDNKNIRVLNKVGAFASLFDGHFPDMRHPVLVLKTEEPGSKQKLAFKYDKIESVCYDMINHLINDIAVMGATPLAVQDAVICGVLDKDIVTRIVSAVAKACEEQGCVLTGGETSVQPGVLEGGTYILTSSIVGVVEKDAVIDGSRIKAGDKVLGLQSSGLHTNGYSLVRALMEKMPEIKDIKVSGVNFIDAILTPHRCYYKYIKDLFSLPGLHGMAHITGGGIEGNLNRVLPEGLDALIDSASIQVPEIFRIIKSRGNVPEADMLKTFNNGVGLTIVADESAAAGITQQIISAGCGCKEIGRIIKGNQKVVYTGCMQW